MITQSGYTITTMQAPVRSTCVSLEDTNDASYWNESEESDKLDQITVCAM